MVAEVVGVVMAVEAVFKTVVLHKVNHAGAKRTTPNKLHHRVFCHIVWGGFSILRNFRRLVQVQGPAQ